jgi:SpoIID/LytB domain protein
MTVTSTRASRALAPLFALGLLALAAPAHAADDWAVPSSATIRIDGHGYGHGHGMSQHGAQGAALQGLTHRQIAEFYYPGTVWGTARGRVTVQISADTTPDVVVLARKGLRVRTLGDGTVTDLAAARPSATQWRLLPVTGGKVRVQHLSGRWRTLRTVAGDAEFFVKGAPTTLVLPGGKRVGYRGTLRASGGDTVNVLLLEKYLRGVVPLEMPVSWEPEALAAQAVAARTYAANGRAHPIAAHYQLCDTTSCQVYGGANAEHPASTAGIKASKGEVLLYDGEPAFTQFSASNGGWSSAGTAPYLVAKKDPYDAWSGNPHTAWQTTVSDGTIEKAFPAIGNLTRIRFLERDGNGQWGGRVVKVRLTGSGGTRTVTGPDLRFALGLRSEWVNLTVS